MKIGIKTKVRFWAKKGGYKWKDNKVRILNNKLLKIEDEIEGIRNWLFDNYTDFREKNRKRRTKWKN